MLHDAEAALQMAARRPTHGCYQIAAATAAAHTARRHGAPADPRAFVALYRGLVALHPTHGARVGLAGTLAALDDADPSRARSCKPCWAVRAHALAALAYVTDATDAFARAIALTADPAARLYLDRQRAWLGT